MPSSFGWTTRKYRGRLALPITSGDTMSLPSTLEHTKNVILALDFFRPTRGASRILEGKLAV